MGKQRSQVSNRGGRQKQTVQVVMKKRSKPRKAILQQYNPNEMVFQSSSNSLSGHLRSLQGAAASGMGTSQMLGTTGNYYLDGLVNPFAGPLRVPDEYARPTAVHQTFAHQDITTDDNGEVTIILNPIWGDGGSADYNKRWISVLQPDVGGSTALTFYDDPDFAIFVTGGLVDGSRPTSAAMLFSYVGDTLSDGGQISACWVPGDISNTTLGSFAAPGTGRGKLALQPGAYSGPLRDGAYVYWKPDDIEDYQLLSTGTGLLHSYPKLVVCIKSTQPNKVVARVAAVTNFEFTTDRRVCETYSGPVEPDLLLHAKKILAHFPAACSNDGHITLWERIQRGCEDFFRMVGNSFRNLFAPSLADINQNAAGINAIGNLVGNLTNPAGAALKGALKDA